MNWFEALNIFLTVVDKRSFSAAARASHSSPSAISKQIKWLETELNTTLLKRSTRALSLTEAGQQCYHLAKQLITDFNSLQNAVKNIPLEPTGSLTVTAPHTYGEIVLAPAIPQFLEEFPKIQLNLNLTNHYLDLVSEGIDIAIRANPGVEKRYQQHSLGHEAIGVFASPSYLKNSPPIKTLTDLNQHHCLIHSDFKHPLQWQFKTKRININPHLTTNSIETLVQAALNNQGIIYLSKYVVTKHLGKGKLSPILTNQWPKPVEHCLLHLRTPFPETKIQAFIDFVLALQNS